MQLALKMYFFCTRTLLMQAINSQFCQSASSCVCAHFINFASCGCATFHRGKNPTTKWKSSMPDIRYTQNSGRLKPRAFMSSTHLAPLAFSPNDTKWVEKTLGKTTTTSAVHNLTAENYSSLSKKEKWVKQYKWFISFHLNSFSKGSVWACHNYSFLRCLTSVMKWILQTGWLRHRGAEATRPQDRPQPSLTESLSKGKLKTSPPYIMCAIFTVITILTLALQLEQWAVGILCAEVPASALTTSKFCFSYQVAMRHGDASWSFYFENFLSLLYTWGGDNTVEGQKTMTLKTYFS